MKIIIQSDNGFLYEWHEGTKTINKLSILGVDNVFLKIHSLQAFSMDQTLTKPSLTNAIKTIENYERDE